MRGRIRSICKRLIAAWPPRSYVNRRVAPDVSDVSRVTLQSPDKYDSDATPIKPQRLM